MPANRYFQRNFRWFALVLVISLIASAVVGCDSISGQVKNATTPQVAGTIALNLPIDESMWYVALNGNDANNCHTAAKPCLLIVTAIDRAKDGDTINIGPGTFYENLRVTKSLSFIGKGIGSTILDGQGETTWKSVFWFDGESHSGSTLLASVSNMTIQNGINASGGWDEIDDGGGIAAVKADLVLNGVDIANNRSRSGGGIYFMHAFGSSDFQNLTISNSTIENNFAESGGGIYCSGNLVMEKTAVNGNSTPLDDEWSKGAGIYFESGKAQLKQISVSKNINGLGAGIFNAGELILTDSWIDSNDKDGLVNFHKTEIYNSTFSNNASTGVTNQGEMFIQNSTISGTQGSTTDITLGAGLANWGKDAVLTAVNITIANGLGAGFIQLSTSTAKVYNSLLANNVYSCRFYSATDERSLVISTINGGNNIAEDISCGSGFVAVGDAKVGPLADYGGGTLTHALLPGSPAIDAGRRIDGLVADQRGESRPKDGNGDGVDGYDVGAYEYDPASIMVIPTLSLIVTQTPLPGLGGIYFTPDQNPNCRSGPGEIYQSIGAALKGQSYLIDGRNQDNNWFYIVLKEGFRCWVSGQSGKVSGDTSTLSVVRVADPTPTFTPTLVPCGDFSRSDCPSYCVFKGTINKCVPK